MRLSPNTGDEKMDEAYLRLSEHIEQCKSFEEFFKLFNFVVKTPDKDVLNRWLLKILFVLIKQDGEHKFDKLLRLVDKDKRAEMETWLNSSLEKFS